MGWRRAPAQAASYERKTEDMNRTKGLSMDWSYESWPSGEPYDWGSGGAARGISTYAARDFHVDLGCGTVKKGRIGVDRYAAPGVNVIMDLNTGSVFGTADEPGADAIPQVAKDARGVDMAEVSWRKGLPFEDGSIESIVSHHCFEHIGDGFLALIDDIYRVLKPGGLLYAITPLFPSTSAVADPDHRRYFMEDTWTAFHGHLGSEDNPTGSWLDSFSVPYTRARFKELDKDMSPPTAPADQWTTRDAREIRVALEAVK